MNGRAVQLDGLRAVAMIVIAWDHWTHDLLPRVFPAEIFLFLFLVLTGFLITGSLLRERERGEASGGSWKWRSMKVYQIRRGLRILAPYYAALFFAWIVRAPDVWPGLPWYVFHVSNIRMALAGMWPSGSAHFWSLAMQQQFYLLWPFVIWFLPKRLILPAVILITAIAPITRWFEPQLSAYIAWPDKMLWAAFDYFGLGALLAIAVSRGMTMESRPLRIAGVLSLFAYLYLFIGHDMGWPGFNLRAVQQTFLSVFLCSLVATAIVGFGGWPKRLLEQPTLLRIGALSYGIYLYHNLAPLAAGKILPFLWISEYFDNGFGMALKLISYAAITWLLTLASWKWIEKPLQEVRAKIRPDQAKGV
ncbi:MAG: acyltransferase [Akkermansiaceae bacterium]|nr:acyltransferase [Akkermansiaceae bacterium]